MGLTEQLSQNPRKTGTSACRVFLTVLRGLQRARGLSGTSEARGAQVKRLPAQGRRALRLRAAGQSGRRRARAEARAQRRGANSGPGSELAAPRPPARALGAPQVDQHVGRHSGAREREDGPYGGVFALPDPLSPQVSHLPSIPFGVVSSLKLLFPFFLSPACFPVVTISLYLLDIRSVFMIVFTSVSANVIAVSAGAFLLTDLSPSWDRVPLPPGTS